MPAIDSPAPASATALHLTANYQSPTNEPFSHEEKLPAPETQSTSDRVTYLAALRKATVNLQERINKELTQRMEEDKVRESTNAGNKKTNRVVDEGKEEQNYGEEVVEED